MSKQLAETQSSAAVAIIDVGVSKHRQEAGLSLGHPAELEYAVLTLDAQLWKHESTPWNSGI